MVLWEHEYIRFILIFALEVGKWQENILDLVQNMSICDNFMLIPDVILFTAIYTISII